MSNGKVHYACLRTYLSDIHKFSLMSEEEFKAKHEKLKLGHLEVTDEGYASTGFIRIACPGHNGERFAKSDIQSFMSIMQRVLKEKARYGLTAEKVYICIDNNQERL